MRVRRMPAFVLVLIVPCVVVACVIGEGEEPGCQTDGECTEGRVCRGGACFRVIGDAPVEDASTDADDAD